MGEDVWLSCIFLSECVRKGLCSRSCRGLRSPNKEMIHIFVLEESRKGDRKRTSVPEVVLRIALD